MKRWAIFFMMMLLTALPGAAQFYLTGDDPARQKWMQISSDHFRVVYPMGTDSLAREYAVALERHYADVGRSEGFCPNGAYSRPLPVILRANTSISNGMVTWTPRRMELYTTPEAYSPGAIPWITDLTVHESRHAAQMQFAAARPYRFYNFLTGQLFPGAMAALYGGPFFLEGDAVVAETALTDAGRGRTADFQEFYRVSFDEGQFRDFYSWCWGSYSAFTPDHYVLGYTMLSGLRTMYGASTFTKDFYDRVSGRHWPHFPFKAFPKAVRAVSGRSLEDTFQLIAREADLEWHRDAERRSPFMPSERVTSPEKHFHELTGSTLSSGSLWAIMTGVADSPRLVSVSTSGEVTKVRPFASYTSTLRSDGDRLYWSESVSDPRWSMASPSLIRCFDGESMRSITSRGNLFNPAPSPGVIAATEYPRGGGSAIVLINPEDGTVISRFPAPGGLQAVESVWVDGALYASAISDGEGFGIYRVDGWSPVLNAGKVKVNRLQSRDGNILFVSDRSSVNELYSLDPSSGDVRQLSCSRFGANDYVFCGDSLYYSVLSTRGRDIFRTALADLPSRTVDFGEKYIYPVAEALSAQEKALPEGAADRFTIEAPERYWKLSHPLRIHSWAPIYFDYDEIMSLSMDVIEESVTPGAVAFFQNDLSTLSGYAGVSLSDARGDDGIDGDVAASGTIYLTYSGLYPVFDLSLNVSNDRSIKYYSGSKDDSGRALYGYYGTAPSVSATIRGYVPLSFSSGGWSRGVIPQVTYSVSNSVFSSSYRGGVSAVPFEGSPEFTSASSMSLGRIAPWHRVSASVRAYSILPRPTTCLYPKLGIGLEAGFCARPGATGAFTPDCFESLYGYLPGISPRQGVKLSLLARQSLVRSSSYRFENSVNPLPRGLESSLMPALSSIYPRQTRLGMDYNIPLFTTDSSFGSPEFYEKGLELGLFADATLLGGASSAPAGITPAVKPVGTLFSAGFSISAVLGNLLWLPYESRIGIRWCRNFGSALPLLPGSNAEYIGAVFDIDM